MPVKRLLSVAAFVAFASSAQTLLFKSGFEPNTTLAPIPSTQTGPGGYAQFFTGTDTSTGYTWTTFPFSPTSAIQLHDEPYNSDLVVNHFFNSVPTVTGHAGASSHALYTKIDGYPQGSCCAQTVFQTAYGSSAPKSVYVRYWMMFPSSLTSMLTGTASGQYYWRTALAWKTMDDYRNHMDFFRNSGTTINMNMSADCGGINASNGAGCPVKDPITGLTFNGDGSPPYKYWINTNYAVTVPIGSWFLVEYYMVRDRSLGSRTFGAINGVTIQDTKYEDLLESGYGTSNEEIRDFYWNSLYSNWFPMDQYIDDFEIWDKPPCGTPPCGAGNTTTYTGPIPPVLTNYRGAVGSVGVPFSFQLKSVNGGTSYSIRSLPPGLSLNGTTGLISGTPTTPGTYHYTQTQVNNSTGVGQAQLTFQINSSLQPPSIRDFSCYPCNISAGNASKLWWNIVGAGTVSVSIDSGVGAVRLSGGNGTEIVSPTVSTTYTLTATNSAGSTSASTTVTVAGSGSLPSISSFTASPSSISSSASSTLSWNTSGASSLFIDQGVGTVTGTTSKVVSPTATTTYTLTATNAYGSVTRAATVSVSTAVLPTISSFAASPATISVGSSSTLAWTVSGATALSISPGIGSVTGTSVSVSPTTSTMYTLTATNSAGSKTAQATVTVPVPNKSGTASLILQ